MNILVMNMALRVVFWKFNVHFRSLTSILIGDIEGVGYRVVNARHFREHDRPYLLSSRENLLACWTQLFEVEESRPMGYY